MSTHLSMVAAVFACLTTAPSVLAQSVPALMNYQGRLTDEAGQPLPNGTYAVQFRLWNSAVAGQPGQTLVWGRQYEVTLVNGVFNAILGGPGGAALPEAAAVNDLQFAFGEAERYLGLTLARLHDGTVIGDAQRKEILPRQQLLSAPFAVNASNGSPPGSVIAFAGSAAPPGWILCDGRLLDRSVHRRLFLAIGEVWGAGDGTTTFGVPDLRGRAPIGAGAGPGLSPRRLASALGSESKSLAVSEIPAHRHFSFRSTDANQVLTAGNTPTYQGWVGTIALPNADFQYTIRAHEGVADVGLTSPTGDGQAFSLVPPSLVLNYIIKD